MEFHLYNVDNFYLQKIPSIFHFCKHIKAKPNHKIYALILIAAKDLMLCNAVGCPLPFALPFNTNQFDAHKFSDA